MSREEFIKKKIRELKEKIPSIDEKQSRKRINSARRKRSWNKS